MSSILVIRVNDPKESRDKDIQKYITTGDKEGNHVIDDMRLTFKYRDGSPLNNLGQVIDAPYIPSRQYDIIIIFSDHLFYMENSNSTIHSLPIREDCSGALGLIKKSNNNEIFFEGKNPGFYTTGNNNKVKSDVNIITLDEYATGNEAQNARTAILYDNATHNIIKNTEAISLHSDASKNVIDSVGHHVLFNYDVNYTRIGYVNGRVNFIQETNHNAVDYAREHVIFSAISHHNSVTLSEDNNLVIFEDGTHNNSVHDKGGNDLFLIGGNSYRNTINTGSGDDIILSTVSRHISSTTQGNNTIMSFILKASPTDHVFSYNRGGSGNDLMIHSLDDELSLHNSKKHYIILDGNDGNNKIIPFLHKSIIQKAGKSDEGKLRYFFPTKPEARPGMNKQPSTTRLISRFDLDMTRTFLSTKVPITTKDRIPTTIDYMITSCFGHDSIYLSSMPSKIKRNILISEFSLMHDVLYFDDKLMQEAFKEKISIAYKECKSPIKFTYGKDQYTIILDHSSTKETHPNLSVKTKNYTENDMVNILREKFNLIGSFGQNR